MAEQSHWDRFADSLGAAFLEEITGAKCAEELLTEPPRKPIRDGAKVDWREAKPVTDVRGLFIAVRQARNNLFHGEKYIGEGYEGARNRQLLMDGLNILERALARSEKTRAALRRPVDCRTPGHAAYAHGGVFLRDPAFRARIPEIAQLNIARFLDYCAIRTYTCAIWQLRNYQGPHGKARN